jgi:Mn-dependent DtxR family transcriptional regulator
MNIIATEDIELLLALNQGQSSAVSRIGEKQRHKMISMGFIRYTRSGYVITELGERMAKSLETAVC